MIDDNVFLLLYGLGFLASFLSEGEWGKKRPGCVLSCIVCVWYLDLGDGLRRVDRMSNRCPLLIDTLPPLSPCPKFHLFWFQSAEWQSLFLQC
jgi:hypothetical protein